MERERRRRNGERKEKKEWRDERRRRNGEMNGEEGMEREGEEGLERERNSFQVFC